MASIYFQTFVLLALTLTQTFCLSPLPNQNDHLSLTRLKRQWDSQGEGDDDSIQLYDTDETDFNDEDEDIDGQDDNDDDTDQWERQFHKTPHKNTHQERLFDEVHQFGRSPQNMQAQNQRGQDGQNGNQRAQNQGPQIVGCIRNCPVTPQYNPVCGTDSVTYSNEGRLNCAKYCGANVEVAFLGICSA